jgi:hypothetical protein
MTPEVMNGIHHVKKGVVAAEVIGVVMGVSLFVFTVYSLHLAVKANRLTIKKLEKEGYT